MRGIGAIGDGADRRGHAQTDAADGRDHREAKTLLSPRRRRNLAREHAAGDRGVRFPWWCSGLPLRRRHHETVKRVAHLDLARQPRIRPHIEAEIQHVLFHRGRRADLLAPGLIDIDMACRAGTGAAAFGFDTRNGIADRGFHHGRAVLDINGAGFAGMVDKADFGHVCSCCRIRRSGLSYNGSIRSALAVGAKTSSMPLRFDGRDQDRRRIASIAMRACTIASLRSLSASDGSWPFSTAASRWPAASATPNAPIAPAEPFSVCASAPASAGEAARLPIRLAAWAENIVSTSRSSLASPRLMRWRWSMSIGPSSGASGGDGLQAIRSRSSGMAITQFHRPADPAAKFSGANHGNG